jgi:two-component system KDP operon response regulator KdpE
MTHAMYRIVVVEDDEGIRNVIRALLTAENYRVVEAETAARAATEARAAKPDLMLVDLGLPDRDGIELIRAVRKASSVPIIVLSARTLEAQKIAALDAGADDYVTKPFSAAELLARVRAGLRRRVVGGERPGAVRIGQFEIGLERREARGPDGELHLTPLEYRVLECLSRHEGMIVRQEQLIAEVWGPNRSDDTRSLRVTIRNLRQKLEPDPRRPRYLVTEAGLGYRLKVD